MAAQDLSYSEHAFYVQRENAQHSKCGASALLRHQHIHRCVTRSLKEGPKRRLPVAYDGTAGEESWSYSKRRQPRIVVELEAAEADGLGMSAGFCLASAAGRRKGGASRRHCREVKSCKSSYVRDPNLLGVRLTEQITAAIQIALGQLKPMDVDSRHYYWNMPRPRLLNAAKCSRRRFLKTELK